MSGPDGNGISREQKQAWIEDGRAAIGGIVSAQLNFSNILVAVAALIPKEHRDKAMQDAWAECRACDTKWAVGMSCQLADEMLIARQEHLVEWEKRHEG